MNKLIIHFYLLKEINDNILIILSIFKAKTLQLWSEYDQLYEQLSEWLKEMESKVKGGTEVKATLEEKLILYDKYKAYNDEVRARQMSFDTLSDKTQFLLQSSTDSRITAQLTQLNSRFTSLLSFTKVEKIS